MALTKVSGDFIDAGSITQGHLHSSHGITTSHIAEGDKLFFTNARVDSRIGSLSSSDLSEGTNLYYTDARARAAISGTGSLSYNSTTGVMSFTMPAQNTSNITEGSNLYYTDARADARVALIVDSAPSTLDTLNELAAALGDDANFSTTITTSIGTKWTQDNAKITNWDTAYGWGDHGLSAQDKTDIGNLSGTNTGDQTLPTLSSLGGASSVFLTNTGGALLEIQNSTDGGSSNGIYMWNTADTNWGIYMGQAGTGKSLSDGVAASGIDGRTEHAIRFRAADSTSQIGFLWENNNEEALMQLVTDTGKLFTRGAVYPSNQTTAYVDSTRIANWQTAYGWGNHASGGYAADSAVVKLATTQTISGAKTFTSLDNTYSGHFYYSPYNAGGAHYPHFLDGANASGVTINWRLYPGGSTLLTHIWDTTKARFVTRVESSIEMRTPIYYDIDDTNYFANPASTSHFSQLRLHESQIWGETTQGHTVGSLHLDPDSATDHTGGAITFGASDSSSGTNAHAGIYVRSDGSYGTKMYFSTTDSYAAGSKTAMYILHNGQVNITRSNLIVQSDVRGTLFYDTNNTSYFLNPSASGGNALNTIGDWRQTTDSWSGEVGGKMQYHGNHWYLQATGYVHFRNASGGNTFYVDQNGIGYILDYLTAQNSLRAPIFYDSNDTTYYLNPNAQSGATSFYTKGDIEQTNIANSTWPYLFTTSGASNSNSSGFWTSNLGYPDMRLRRDNSTVRALISSWERSYTSNGFNDSSDMRAPIFYDLNDTTYYTNPAGESKIIKLWINNGGAGGVSWSTGLNMGSGSNYWNLIQDASVARQRNFGTGGYDWFSSGGTQLMTLDNGGTLFAAADMRSPIFYDSNDTGYYVNPNSTSNFNKIKSNSAQAAPRYDTAFYVLQAQHYYGDTGSQEIYIGESGNNINIRGVIDANGGHGGINITNTSIVSSAASTWTGDPGGDGKIQYHSNRWYIVSDSSSNRIAQFRRNGSDKSYIDNDGRLMDAPDLRVPIYYDTNTAYYGDFASHSHFNTMSSAGGLLFGSNYGVGVTGLYTSTRIQTIFNMGAAYKVPNDGASTGNAYGLYWSHQNAGSVGGANNLASHGIIILEAGSYKGSWGGGRLITPADVRGTLFYDYNNTAYYCDPHSTSNLAGLSVGSVISGSITKTAGTSGYGHVGTGMWPFYNWGGSNGGASAPSSSTYTTGISVGSHPGDQAYGFQLGNNMWNRGLWMRDYNSGWSSWYQMMDLTSNSQYKTGLIQSNASLRAPIFYDSSNTVYYTRPATSSYINSLHTAGQIQVGSSGSSLLYLGNTSGNYFRFHTNNADTYFDANVGNIYWRQGASTRFYFYMTTANMTINGTLTQYSDIRFKENIVEIPDAIDKIKSIRGVYYNRTDFNTEPTKIGVIAQEVEVLMPELVLEAEDTDMKSVSYNELTAVLVQAIKEQQTIIDDLKSRLETLENQ